MCVCAKRWMNRRSVNALKAKTKNQSHFVFFQRSNNKETGLTVVATVCDSNKTQQAKCKVATMRVCVCVCLPMVCKIPSFLYLEDKSGVIRW